MPRGASGPPMAVEMRGCGGGNPQARGSGLVLVSGLQLATGARVEPDLSESGSYGYFEKFIYLIMIVAVIFLVW